ncbi:MAG TPA: helix-turn-helix transcriptional regulator [Longimicrobiaceae bacterium]
MTKRRLREGVDYELSTGNPWADAGRPDAEEAYARSQLMEKLTKLIRERRLTQAKAAQLLGTTQPTVSDLMRGKLSLFSLERLMAFLRALDQDVEITVTPRPTDTERPAKVRVSG